MVERVKKLKKSILKKRNDFEINGWKIRKLKKTLEKMAEGTMCEKANQGERWKNEKLEKYNIV